MNLCQPRVSGTVHLLLNIHQSSVLETLGLKAKMLGMKLVDLHQPEIDGVSSKISWVRHPTVDNRIIVPCLLQTQENLWKRVVCFLLVIMFLRRLIQIDRKLWTFTALPSDVDNYLKKEKTIMNCWILSLNFYNPARINESII